MSKEKIEQITTIIAVIILGFLVYALDYNDSKVEQAREERINNMKTRLQQQEHYMHQVQADIDNLKEVLQHE